MSFQGHKATNAKFKDFEITFFAIVVVVVVVVVLSDERMEEP